MTARLDPAAAETRLRRMTQADVRPVLSDEEIADLVTLAQRPDAAGLVAGEAGWVPTYSLLHAAAEGWVWKAGKAVSEVNVAAGDVRAERSQTWDHCMRMAERYRDLAATGAWDDGLGPSGGNASGGSGSGGFGVIPVRPGYGGEW